MVMCFTFDPLNRASPPPRCTVALSARLQAANHTLNDPERSAATASLDPTGRFAAVTDHLGRVLILDIPMMCIVNVLKGYRNCQAAWLFNPPSQAPGVTPLQGSFLVLHLPRRGVVEMWKMGPHMSRIHAAKVGYGCCLVQAAPEFSATSRAHSPFGTPKAGGGPNAPWSHQLMASCYLLTSNGDLHFLDASLSFKHKPASPQVWSIPQPIAKRRNPEPKNSCRTMGYDCVALSTSLRIYSVCKLSA